MNLIEDKSNNLLPIQSNPQKTATVFNIPDTIQFPPDKPIAFAGLVYNKQQIINIINDIAACPGDTIEEICTKNALTDVQFWYITTVSPEIQTAYYSARKVRTGGMIEKKWRDGEKIEETIENIDLNSDTSALEIRRQEARIRLLRVQSLNAQYEASRLNPNYRDKQEITHELGAGTSRAQAWDDWSKDKQLPPKDDT